MSKSLCDSADVLIEKKKGLIGIRFTTGFDQEIFPLTLEAANQLAYLIFDACDELKEHDDQ